MGDGVNFKCPRCARLAKWSTERGIGICGTRGCGFKWSRRFDHLFFVRADGSLFASAGDLERELGLPISLERPVTLGEMLSELLGQVMIRPPTPHAIERWTRDERRLALEWISRSLLGDEITQVERPAFIEEGLATA